MRTSRLVRAKINRAADPDDIFVSDLPQPAPSSPKTEPRSIKTIALPKAKMRPKPVSLEEEIECEELTDADIFRIVGVLPHAPTDAEVRQRLHDLYTTLEDAMKCTRSSGYAMECAAIRTSKLDDPMLPDHQAWVLSECLKARSFIWELIHYTKDALEQMDDLVVDLNPGKEMRIKPRRYRQNGSM